MKNFIKRLSAILTAAVMTISAAGTVSAQDGQQEEAPKYTGWVTADSGWQYLADGEPYNSGVYKIDGVMREFSYNHYDGVYSGWKDGRRYDNGLPYTGWTETKDGRKYYLDGYAVTGEFPINDEICTFSSKGIYQKSRTPDIAVTCGERVSTDTKKITFTAENLTDESRKFKVAKSFEIFKDGKWVSCKSKVLYSRDDKKLSKKGEKLSFEVDVSEYSGNKFNEGFYRLPVICGEETYYAVFEAVSPIELKSRKDEYVFANNVKTSGGAVKLDMIINSGKKDMQAESVANNIIVKLEKQTENGWTEIKEDFPWEIGYGDGGNRLDIAPEFIPEEGCYRVTVTVGKYNCADTFRVRNHMAAAWLDEYDLNNKDLTISFTVINCGDEPIKICTFLYGLYQKNDDGTWKLSDIEGAAVERNANAYTTLKGGKSTTVNFDISNYYNMSELTAGEYAVDIGGIGLAEFTLTDKPVEKNLPFKDLKAEDVKEIKIVDASCEDSRTLFIKPENREYFNRSIDYLRQFELKDRIKNYEIPTGGVFTLTLTLKDGTEKHFRFYSSREVMLSDGKAYCCTKNFSSAFHEFISELAEYVQYESYYDDYEEPELEEDLTPFRTDT